MLNDVGPTAYIHGTSECLWKNAHSSLSANYMVSPTAINREVLSLFLDARKR